MSRATLGTTLGLALADGESVTLPVDRWLGPPLKEELALLDRATGPVLDVGCGPGRHVLALSERGIVALGVDVAPSAVGLALGKGAAVLLRSVFERLPGSGRWASTLLLDGNVGIGGDPVALLRRMRELMRARGRAFVECDGPGRPTRTTVARLTAPGAATDWFPWATVGIDGLPRLSSDAGFVIADCWGSAGRWFASLEAQ